MFRELFLAVISWILSAFNVLKHFVLDDTLHITFFHFLLFCIFISIVIRLINFLKEVQEVQSENEKERYQAWLKSHPSTPRRFR